MRRLDPSTYVLFAFAAFLSLLASPAAAHDLPRERTILLETSAKSVEAMVVYQEPPGKRVNLLKAQFDFDGDGRLTGPEADAAGSTWVEYALQDLEIRIDGEKRDRSTEKIKFRNEHNGALTAAIYLKWDVPGLEPGDDRKLTVRRKTKAPSFTTLVRCQARGAVELSDAPGSVEGGTTGPYELAPDSELHFVARRERDEFRLPTRPP